MRYFTKLLSLLMIVSALSGCAVLAIHPSLAANTGLPDLIPVRDFVANRGSNFSYKISPDGKKLAWIAVKGASLHIYIKNLETNTTKTIPAAHWYGGVVWAQDSRHLISDTFGQQGTENTLIITLDTEEPDDNLNKKIISPYGGIKSQLVQQIIGDPAHILIAHNQRDETNFDLFRININTEEQTLIAENPGNVTKWLTNQQGELAGRIVKQVNTKVLELRQPIGAGFKAVYQWTLNDTVKVVSITDNGAKAYLLSNKGRDRLVLLELAGESNKETVVYEDPVADITDIYKHPANGKPLIAFSNPDYPKAVLLDQSLNTAFSFLKNDTPASLTIDSSDNQLHRMTIRLHTDKGTENYLYDLKTNTSVNLGNSPMLENRNLLADVTPIEIASRDNVSLRGYLTLPKGVVPRQLPLVLLVHGGPWDRDYWHYNSEVQFLANRGYAVLQVNFRGSTGYGRRFQELAIGEFAGKMHDDLLDAVNWAVNRGIADPAKIAIVGTSYGGYAALVGLTFTPDVFTCGIDINGMSDLVKFTENYPPYWKLEMDLWYRYVGDPRNDADRVTMQTKSPLFKAADITKPLMVIQGADDVRVKKEHSVELVIKLEQDHKDFDFWLIPGAGHGLIHWPIRLKQFRKTEDFLANCLGGRSSGFDFYQLGAWLF